LDWRGDSEAPGVMGRKQSNYFVYTVHKE
jgi:hypothetical protein